MSADSTEPPQMEENSTSSVRERQLAKARLCRCHKFLPFPLLPTEIRLKIWNAAMPRNSLVVFPQHGAYRNKKVAGMFTACRESHQAVIEWLPGSIPTFDKVTLSWRQQHQILIDPQLHVITFRTEHLLAEGAPLSEIRHIGLHASQFWPRNYHILSACTQLRTITLIERYIPCGSLYNLYDLAKGPNPRLSRVIKRLVAQSETDFDQGLISFIPTIHAKILNYPQEELKDWNTVKGWFAGLNELQILANNDWANFFKLCSVCHSGCYKPVYTVCPVLDMKPKLPISLWKKIWRMAAPMEELKKLESFFAHSGEGIKSLGSSDSLQLRAHVFDNHTRLVTIGQYSARQKSMSLRTIQFHPEGIFSFWDMCKWKSLGWSGSQIVSWDGGYLVAGIKKLEMKSEEFSSITKIFLGVIQRMIALEEIVIV